MSDSHWTLIESDGRSFYCSCKCGWDMDYVPTRAAAVQQCITHRQESGPGYGPVPAACDGKVAKLVNLAFGTANDSEALLAFQKARAMHRRTLAGVI